MRDATDLTYTYDDGVEVHSHPATVRAATPDDVRFDPACHVECGTPISVGHLVIVTDEGVQGESYAHLGCLLHLTGSLQAR